MKSMKSKLNYLKQMEEDFYRTGLNVDDCSDRNNFRRIIYNYSERIHRVLCRINKKNRKIDR